jgi:predicted metal-dependent hydrolase
MLSSPAMAAELTIDARPVPLRLVRDRRARRYILRLTPDGAVRVTVPRWGSIRAAQAFAARNRDWIARQRRRQAARPRPPRVWTAGTAILYRGEPVTLTRRPDHTGDLVEFADQQIRIARETVDLRPAIERHLWIRARGELIVRTCELAARLGVPVQGKETGQPPLPQGGAGEGASGAPMDRRPWSAVRPLRITIRNQCSKWGSCSARRTISLNWRLIQVPAAVRDYIIIHELMHLWEMNHSRKFWALVAQACPDWTDARRWLKGHRSLLG